MTPDEFNRERVDDPQSNHLLPPSASHENDIHPGEERVGDYERVRQSPSLEPHPESAPESTTDLDTIDEESLQKDRNPLSLWRLFSKVFIWEILAITLSTGLLLSIVVIGAKFNKQPQPSWRYMSLNSMISWLSTLSKACVLFAISEGLGQLKWVWFAQRKRAMSDIRAFDAASRGIYGSAELIWSMRARHFAVAGSLAVILAIAFDPFNQNLIHNYPKLVDDSTQTATVSISSDYDALGPATGALNLIDSNIKANVYNSIFNTDSSKPWSIPRFGCSSGNCTWDPLVTLAMSSSCTSISDKLQTTCMEVEGELKCSSYLAGEDAAMDGSVAINFTMGSIIGTPVALGSTESFVYPSRPIAPMQMVALDFDKADRWGAFECAFLPVVRSFRPSVTEGVYREETLGVWKEGDYDGKDILSGSYILKPPWGPEMGMERNTTFGIRQTTLITMMSFLRMFFSGRMEINNFGQSYKPNAKSTFASEDLMQAVASPTSNITGCTVEGPGKLQCAVENAAEAMSKSFRDHALSAQQGTTVFGKAMTSKTYIVIHWQWIALPVVVWLLGVFTLVGVIWKTRKTIAPTWKNDVMPLLTVYEHGQNQISGMAEELYKEKVELFDDEGRIKLGNQHKSMEPSIVH
ncbi:hypothetical protein N7452_007097 [Penicillium brevicompactum]|uniref:Uncharacterized protein n=1 Tax=Penicillium brevicompactum TaxID=5074 RepID=A0A9W9UD77_PENBR|nr:hypothetical protein N7452_007097 [Penicillium brevicompactum]